MTKSKLFAVVCVGMLLCTSFTTFGMTTINVKDKKTYSKDVKASIGYYHAYTSTSGTTVYTSATNRSTQKFYFEVSTIRIDYDDNIQSPTVSGKGLEVGETLRTNGLTRKISSGAIAFEHKAYGYASSSSASGKIESFEFRANQHY